MPPTPWLTPGGVLAYIEDSAEVSEPNPDRQALQLACDAAAGYVEGKHPTYLSGDLTSYSPPADIKLGATMLAARYYARRGSALGAAGFSEFGGDTILRNDPDIARLLRTGMFAAFGFGAPSVEVVVEETIIDGGDATP